MANGCAYGKLSEKKYRLWTTGYTTRLFTFAVIDPTDPESMCTACKEGRPKHDQAQIPSQGTRRQRVAEKGYTQKAAKMRVPWRLSRAVGKCMLAAYKEIDRGTS